MTKRQIGPAVAAAVVLCVSAADAQPAHDGFYWIGEMNKASAVMVVDTKIVDRDLGGTIAEAVAKVIRDGERPGAARSDDYLRVEPLLIAAGGPDVTRLHSGRSRQGPIENSFDANHVSPFDLDAEVASLVTASAIVNSALLADLLDQYRQIRPWFLLAASETTPSSIMPQKRNPLPMLLAREQASRTLGLAHNVVMLAHNIGPGVIEYRGDAANNALQEATQLQVIMTRLVRTLRFDGARALEEVNGDYATTTELADVLQREANIPFRIGHHFASELVNFGRGHGLRAVELPYEVANRIFAQLTKDLLGQEAAFPLSEARFREVLTPENMVRASRGLGGPQPTQVARILAVQEAQLAADGSWLEGRRSALAQASALLDVAFTHLKNCGLQGPVSFSRA
ncbi:hypothetical protein [Bradyrhizobium sp. USDA 10063]